MTPIDETTGDLFPLIDGSGGYLILRSNVPADLPYGDYKRFLQHDFFYSCAYCTMTEAEASAMRFTIDHYLPRAKRPDLENVYSNLLYCCDECNTRKGKRSSTEAQLAKGLRFFRPDEDVRPDHFLLNGILLEPLSEIGAYSTAALSLNRLSLRRVRQIRQRLAVCDEFVAHGMTALRKAKIDRLPPNSRAAALRAINRADQVAEQLAGDIDELLRAGSQSPLTRGEEESPAERKARLEYLKRLDALEPGGWRRDSTKGKPTTRT